MGDKLVSFLKKNSIVSTIVFLALSFYVAFSYNFFNDRKISLIVSLIIWGVLAVYTLISKYPNKIFNGLDKFKFVLALTFSSFFLIWYMTTNRVSVDEFNVLAVALSFVVGFWFYYTVIPEITPNFKKRLIFSLIAVTAFTFMIYIYLPMESFIKNINDFEFDCSNFIYQFSLIFASVTVVLTLLLNAFKAKFYWVIYRIFIALELSSFIQYLYLNSNLSLLGVANDYSFSKSLIIGNLVIWILVFAVAIFIPKFVKNAWPKVFKALSAVVLGYHIIALIVLCVLAPKSAFVTTIDYYAESSDQFKFSKNNNVIVMVFDAFDNKIINEMIETKPEYFDGLEDFTVYTNTSSVYDSTVTSMNQIFGNCQFDNTLVIDEWLDKGWNSDITSDFYSKMHDNGYKCNAYNFELPMKEFAVGKFDNYKKFEDSQKVTTEYFNTDKFISDFELLVTYRICPYLIKDFITFDSLAFKFYATYIIEESASYWNDDYLENMNSIEFVDENIMTVNHLNGLHSPCVVPDEIDNCFGIMTTFVDELKANGVYDDSLIIFMSDHGWHNEDSTTDGWGATPMLFVKAPHASNDDTVFSSAPVSTLDILGTIADETGIGKIDGLTSLNDFDENSQRVRYFYDRFYSEDLPFVYSKGMLFYFSPYNCFIEYEIDGDSATIYGVDPVENGNNILPMKEYFG